MRWLKPVSFIAVIGILTSLAIFWPGEDEQQVPVYDSAVWAMQSGSTPRYAKVSSTLGEFVSVNTSAALSDIVQSPESALLYFSGGSRMLSLNLADPKNVDDAALESLSATPSGTETIISNQDFVGYLTNQGSVFTHPLKQGEQGHPRDFDSVTAQNLGREGTQFQAAAIALSETNQLFVLVLSGGMAEVYAVQLPLTTPGRLVASFPYVQHSDSTPQLGARGDRWVVLSDDSSTLWSSGFEAGIATPFSTETILGTAQADTRDIVLASPSGLYRYDLSRAELAPLLGEGEVSGIPAVPVNLGGVDYAAWTSANSVQLWDSVSGLRELDLGGTVLNVEPEPKFQFNGDTIILNELVSGLVWTLPDGALVRSSLNWSLSDNSSGQETGDEVASVVTEPKPPVAVDDTFGVREGSLTRLAVLLNDYDPNGDAISIIPSSLRDIPAELGTIRLANNNQELILESAPGVSGTYRFSYAVTDGTVRNGLNSAPATVTVRILPQQQNSAPVWCGLDNCLAELPNHQLASGGSLSLDVLSDWVDPEGDPMFLAEAKILSGPGSVAFQPSGKLIYRHPDPHGDGGVVVIEITVSDIHGAKSSQQIRLTVTSSPRLRVESLLATGVAGNSFLVDPSSKIFGNSGAYFLSDVRIVDGIEGGSAEISRDRKGLRIFAPTAGSLQIQFNVSDQLSTETGSLRVQIAPAESAQIQTVPLVAFVTSLDDSTVNVLNSVSNPAGRGLSVTDVIANPIDGQVSLGVRNFGDGTLKVSGSSADGRPGKLGTIRYLVTDGTDSTTGSSRGELTVYLLEERSSQAPLLIDDHITVAPGVQIDIPVLDNDISQGFGELVLDQEITKADPADPGLAFASGRVLRYLAPEQPGNYELHYRAYSQSAVNRVSVGTVHITVQYPGLNTPPSPRILKSSVQSGGEVIIPVETFGVDPDGDEVFLDQVLVQPRNGVASLSLDGKSLLYQSFSNFLGQDEFSYQVRDSRGAVGNNLVRVAVVQDARYRESIIALNDYLMVARGDNHSVLASPLLNDHSENSKKYLLNVEPGVHPDSPEYSRLASMIGKISADHQQVELFAGTEIGTFPFIYTVATEAPRPGQPAPASAVTARILLTVSATVPADYPIVSDTILDLSTRGKLPNGIDVVSGKVSWSTGMSDSLSVVLLDPVSSGVQASGRRISGPLQQNYQIIPFALSANADLEPLAYGFLRIPDENSLRLKLLANGPQLEVPENESNTLQLRTLIDVPAGGVLETLATEVRSAGIRSNGVCSIEGTILKYEAGLAAPWNDICVVPVKLSSQTVYSYLPIPVKVLPVDPVPTLSRAELEIRPGTSASFDISSVTGWVDTENTSNLV
ncbi:MAG: Ig-like domain-containing protein, partial [Microbacteriaceae bacterium]